DFDELVRSIEALKTHKPGEKASREEKEKFVDSICRLWLSALGIASETATLSPEESQALGNYFYICELMIRCKESATRVSPDVWESLESSILTVPTNAEQQ
ncbi:MAG: NTPase (NACHT family), partial [Cyanobacteria bacterium P01_A01_bin.17]